MNNVSTPATSGDLQLKVAGMDCGSCAMTIEKAVAAVPGVAAVRVDFTTETLRASGTASRDDIEARVRMLGYRIADERQPVQLPQRDLRGFAGFLQFLATERRTRIALLGTLLIVIAAGLSPLVGTLALDGILLATVAIAGLPIFVKGLRSLLVARQVTIDLLMGIAAVGAVGIGEVGEAAAVVLLFTLGEALEAYSAERSRDALRSLMSLQPDEATVLEAHADSHGDDEHADCADHAAREEPGHGHQHRVAQGAPGGHAHLDEHGDDHACDGTHAHSGPQSQAAPAAGHGTAHVHQRRTPSASVPVGARVLVRPGERIPLDGRVTDGSSGVNQAAVTGESIPVARGVGDEVLAGTVNGSGVLTIEVTRPAGDSTVTRIAKLVERALAERTPAERFIDRFARWYTPLVVGLAALIVAVPVLVFGQPLLDTADGTHGWLYRGLAMLIIACPCALIISIPVTVVSALTRLAQKGVLVKGGAQLDRLAGVDIVAFDKTGTLTAGRPAVTAVRGPDCAHEDAVPEDCETCDDIVATAAAVEAVSEHPLAQAVMSRAAHRGLMYRNGTAVSVTAHAGKGVSGEVGGQRVTVGHHELLDHPEQCGDAICDTAGMAQAGGKTVMLVGRGRDLLGFIGVEDQPRADSGTALRELHALDSRLRTVMLTGDNQRVAEAIGQQIGGIDEIRAGLMPADKLGAIRQLQQRGVVAMVGDGINDAPALAQADVGIAMGGGGTAQAMETADMVLMRDDIRAVPMALRISRYTRSVVKQNIALSLGLKLLVLALAIPGLASLWLAVLADVGATLLVTLNGMRLLRAR
jgi:Cd2+/Zn2+-exporting ATPase